MKKDIYSGKKQEWQIEKMGFRKAGLKPLKGKFKIYPIFGFDIETYNRNKNFLCASIIGDNYQKIFYNKEDIKKELSTNRIFRGSYLCATNLLFDFFGIFEIQEALENFNLIERAGSLILATTHIKYDSKDYKFYNRVKLMKMLKKLKTRDKAKIKEFQQQYYQIKLIDSANHLKTSVEKLGKIVNFPKLEKPVFLGKYPRNKKEWEIIIKYNIRDSTVTYRFMQFIQEQYNKMGCEMKTTISSTSLDLFRRKYLRFFWKQQPRDHILFTYRGMYGGRTEAYKRGIFNIENYGKIKVYDINSLYPFCLKNFKFPIPSKSTIYKKCSSNVIDSFNGVGYFELEAPKDLHIPLLPVKTDKLRFATGNIKGHYDFYSIRQALNMGYQLLKIKNCIVYEHTFKPFSKFIDNQWDLRQELRKREDNTQIVPKITMNSFYGKLIYNFTNKEMLGTHEDVLFSKETDSILPTKDKSIFRIVTTENSRIPNYVFPIIPIMVTAYARNIMQKYFRKIGYEKILYTDTDCIFTTKKLNTSLDIGKLKLEESFKEVCIIKPKFYAGIPIDDKPLIKIKGMHNAIKSYKHFKEMVLKNKFRGNNIHFRKLRSAIGQNNKYVNEIYEMIKEMGLDDDKRLWQKEHFTPRPQESEPICL